MKVELNFSEHAGDEAMAIAVWRAMTGMGRGRAQSLFRQCVIAGLRNMRESDLPEDVYALISQGVKPVKRDKKKEAPVTGDDVLLPGLIAEDHVLSKSRKRSKEAHSSDRDAHAVLPEEIPSQVPLVRTSSPPSQEEKTSEVEPEAVLEQDRLEDAAKQSDTDSSPSTEAGLPPSPSLPPSAEPITPEIPQSAETVVKPPHRKKPMFQGIMG